MAFTFPNYVIIAEIYFNLLSPETTNNKSGEILASFAANLPQKMGILQISEYPCYITAFATGT